MYRRFAFEGNIHDSLDCVPLVVRRKLDLAGLKISLAGWQTLPRAERLALCHLPVDAPDDLAVYREVMTTFAERAGVPLGPLPRAEMDPSAWSAAAFPARLKTRCAEIGSLALEGAWPALDEETRYALYKLADPKRAPEKLQTALAEIGLAPADPAAQARAAEPCGPPVP